MTQSKSHRVGVANQNLATTWCRRLLTVAAMLILGAATVLALHAIDPQIGALIAGEGTVFSDTGR